MNVSHTRAILFISRYSLFFYFIDSLGILATTSLSCVGVSTLKSGLKKINWVQLHTVYIFFAPSSSPPPKKTLCWSVKSFLCSCRVPHPIKVFPPRANRMSRKWQRSLIFRYNTLWSRSWGILLSILCHKKRIWEEGNFICWWKLSYSRTFSYIYRHKNGCVTRESYA